MNQFLVPRLWSTTCAATTGWERIAARAGMLMIFAAMPGGVAAVTAGPPAGYYDAVDDTNATTLRATLHEVIDDHQRFPYSSSGSDTWDILELADEDPGNPANIIDVYKNSSHPKAGGGNSSYNREHVWPSSYGFPDDGGSNYPYTDCHQLRLCDISYNSARGSKPFRYCNASCTAEPTDANNGQGGINGPYPSDSNWRLGSGPTGTWEVWIGRRGDIARSMFYMDVRYEGGLHGGTGAMEPDLILTDNAGLISFTGTNSSVAYMGLRTTLYEWHLEDPVDQTEQERNDIVFSFQGNRNPFVDHPEWVAVLFGQVECTLDEDCDDGLFCNGDESCDGSDVCVSGTDPCPALGCDEALDQCIAIAAGPPWINEFHYDDASTDEGEFFEIAGPAGVNLGGWTLIGYNGATGDPYDTIALTGVIPDQGGCAGTLDFDFPGLQNGGPDGLALVDPAQNVVEFISYEGAFTAGSGPAMGLTSTDIGVSEPSSTTAGFSLQLTGLGSTRDDFTWQAPSLQTRGTPNTDQTIDACIGIPAVSTWGMVIATLFFLTAGTIVSQYARSARIATAR